MAKPQSLEQRRRWAVAINRDRTSGEEVAPQEPDGCRGVRPVVPFLDLCKKIRQDLNDDVEVFTDVDIVVVFKVFLLSTQTQLCALWKSHESFADDVTFTSFYFVGKMQSGLGKSRLLSAFLEPLQKVIERMSKEDKRSNTLAWPYPLPDNETPEMEQISTQSEVGTVGESPRRIAEQGERITIFSGTGTSAGFTKRMDRPVRFCTPEGMMLLSLLTNPKETDLMFGMLKAYSVEAIEKVLKDGAMTIKVSNISIIAMAQTDSFNQLIESHPQEVDFGLFARMVPWEFANVDLPETQAAPTVRPALPGEFATLCMTISDAVWQVRIGRRSGVSTLGRRVLKKWTLMSPIQSRRSLSLRCGAASNQYYGPHSK